MRAAAVWIPAVLFVVTALPSPVLACSCILFETPAGQAPRFGPKDVVFTARVVPGPPPPEPDDSELLSRVIVGGQCLSLDALGPVAVELRVKRVHQGRAPRRLLYEAGFSGSCSRGLVAGHDYLVVGRWTERGELYVSQCSETRVIESAADPPPWFGPAMAPPKPPVVGPPSGGWLVALLALGLFFALAPAPRGRR